MTTSGIAGFTKAGGTVVKELFLPFPSVEFKPLLTEIASIKPDAVFVFFAGAGGIKLIKDWKAAGLKGRVRVNTAGCLDHCALGATMVVYPEAVWYGRVTLEDVDEILQSHLVEGKPVERLRLHRERPDRT